MGYRLTYACRQAQEREINVTPHPPRVSVEDYTLRQRRGESSQDHGDQAGRDGGTKKKDKEEDETLDDLQQNEDERRRIQPLLKTNSKAPERSSS